MWKRMVRGVVVSVVLFLLLASCMPKVKQAMEDADAAIREAEAAGAKSKYPELYDAARSHFREGERQKFLFRWNLARFQFEASKQAGEIAAKYSRGEIGSATCPQRPSCPTTPADWSWSNTPDQDDEPRCCDDYQMCLANARGLEKRLKNCSRPRTVYVSEGCPRCPEVSREPCREEGPQDPTAAYDQLLMGMFSVTGPGMIESGKTDYEVVVKYQGSTLDDKGAGAARAANDYRLLIDVAQVEPPEVTAGSPTVDYEPLSSHGGEWKLPVNVPDAVKGPVTVTVEMTLLNTASGKEQKLPPTVVLVPAAGDCPKPKPCPEIKMETRPEASGGPSWGLALAMLVVGLGAGAGGGFLLFGRKKPGPTISAG
jgi:hypothetical protein